MRFEDVVASLGQAFSLELKVVQGATVFEVASEDGGTKVKVLIQDMGERRRDVRGGGRCHCARPS